ESATDQEVIEAFRRIVKSEGLIPALESTHGVVQALREAPQLSEDDVILINLSGRGDKDIFTIAEALGDERWREFLRSKVEEYDRGENPPSGGAVS
ncbi:MAG: tryptophan synthase subunit beta, partial [Planctomycetes bacterium]|nr:tryptophan synthase subunit beta [Planctomycetota bacterium]